LDGSQPQRVARFAHLQLLLCAYKIQPFDCKIKAGLPQPIKIKNMGKFRVSPNATGSQYYFGFYASNGEQILASESYTTRQGCLNGIAAVKARAPYDAAYIRSDATYNYRFNMIGSNYEIIARSSEGYVSTQGRENAINVVKREAPTAPIE
jgi:uncharacterized protein